MNPKTLNLAFFLILFLNVEAQHRVNVMEGFEKMKISKLLSIKMKYVLLCLLIPAIAFGQSFNDLIITVDNDTIVCRIIDVNRRNIRYYTEDQHNRNANKISQRLVKAYHVGESESFDSGISARPSFFPDDDSDNWILLTSGDTSKQISKVFYASKDSRLIRKIRLADRHSTTIVYPWEIEAAFLNGTFYESVFFPNEYAGFFRKKTDTTRNSLTQFLGYYIIADSVSLMRYGKTTEKIKNTDGYIAPPKLSYGKYLDDVSGLSIYEKHCIKKGDEVISLPSNYGGFYRTVKKHFSDDKELMYLIDKKLLLYKDLEEIVRRYNEGLRQTQSAND
jgi:hypothetical protein